MEERIVTDWLDEASICVPEKIAYGDVNREVSYTQLKKEAYKVASFLIKCELFKESVAIFMDKTVDCVASFMGVAYSGNFYTPLDAKMPIERIESILSQLHTKVIIADSKNIKKIKELSSSYYVIEYTSILEMPFENGDIISQRRSRIKNTDIAYVMFTSGSTGVPKGVVVSHFALVSYVNWLIGAMSFSEKTILGNQTPFYFSMSVSDIYGTIACRGTLYMIPKMLFSFPIKLLDYINSKKINTIYWVPSALCIVAESGVFEKRNFDYLEKVMFAGEVMPVKQYNIWKRKLPRAFFANLFGPTETVDICAYYIIDSELNECDSIPIGYACEGAELIIIDEDNSLVLPNLNKDSRIGEMYVAGTILASGYWGDNKKTEEVFVQNPLHNKYPQITYRTGDLVHYDSKGRLVYDGRKDYQIKHMGHRIEMGEIESIVGGFSGVSRCVALYDDKNKSIFLFYIGECQEEDVIIRLKQKLPVYMVPKKIKRLKYFPVNANGKVDRAKLKENLV